jgi:hypothetical protein
MSDIEGFETAAEAAIRFDVHDSQVRRLAAEGRIPGAVKVAGVWLIPADSWPEEVRGDGPGRPPQWAGKSEG